MCVFSNVRERTIIYCFCSCIEARIMRDRDYQERHCASLRKELVEIVNHKEEWEQHEQRLSHLAKAVRSNIEQKNTYRSRSQHKRQTAYVMFGKEMEAQEARKNIEQFERIINHIQESTGLHDYEQVYEYLTTFKGKTESLKSIRDDAESKIAKMKAELDRLEGVREGLVNRQVVSLDKMASHLDKPIQVAESKFQDYQDKYTRLRKLLAHVGTALESIKGKVSPLVPQSLQNMPISNANGPQTSSTEKVSSSERGMAVIHEEMDGETQDLSSAADDRHEIDTSSENNEVLTSMMAAERALLYSVEILSNPNMGEEVAAKPASRRRPASLITSMYNSTKSESTSDNSSSLNQSALREREVSAVTNTSSSLQASSNLGDNNANNTTSPSLGTNNNTQTYSQNNSMASSADNLTQSSSRRRSVETPQSRRERIQNRNKDSQNFNNPSVVGAVHSSTGQSSHSVGDVMGVLDVTKVAVSQNNIRVPLDTDRDELYHSDREYHGEFEEDDHQSVPHEPTVTHARRESVVIKSTEGESITTFQRSLSNRQLQ